MTFTGATVQQTEVVCEGSFEVFMGFNQTWVGNVWPSRGFWVVQDWDGDTENFDNMADAVAFVVSMAGASC